MTERDARNQPVLDPQAIRRVARLARLEISDEQVLACSRELSSVLDHIDRLRTLDLDGVEPMTHPSDIEAPLADDVPEPGLPTSVLLGMAPEADAPFVKVPPVFRGGPDA